METTPKPTSITTTDDFNNSATTNPQSTQLNKLRQWQVHAQPYAMPTEPHKVVFWCSTWGANLTYMVWKYCSALVWPDPSTTTASGDPGISWTELAISFMHWTNKLLPIRIKKDKGYHTLQYDDPQVALLPVKTKSLRVLAENFRWIVKHIQTFSRQKYIPAYKKQGTTSLTRLGFTSYHEGGVSRRPVLPNPDVTYTYITQMLNAMPHDPPYHTEILPLALLPNGSPCQQPNLPEVSKGKQDAFIQHVRYALFRGKPFDTIKHPDAS